MPHLKASRYPTPRGCCSKKPLLVIDLVFLVSVEEAVVKHLCHLSPLKILVGGGIKDPPGSDLLISLNPNTKKTPKFILSFCLWLQFYISV